MKLATMVAAFIAIISGSLSASPCYTLEGQSCWTFKNETNVNVDIKCYLEKSERKIIELIEITDLDYQTVSYQMDVDYGDGLGFPEPNAALGCEVLRDGRFVTRKIFHSIGWGDRVKVRLLSGDHLQITV